MEEASVKGQTVISFLKFLDEAMPGKRQAVLETVAPRYRDELSKRMVLATNVYPMSLLNQMTIEGAKLVGQPVDEFARHAGRFAAKEGVQGVYRVFVRVLNPNTVLSKAAAMWSTMNTGGKMSADQLSANSAAVWLRDYPNPQPVMCARISGWIEQLAGMTGVTATVVHRRCAAVSGSECEWKVEW